MCSTRRFELQSLEIPAQQWGPFLDTISRRHEGETIFIEQQKADANVQGEAHEARLVGISLDTKLSRNREIDVKVRTSANAHLMHAIVQPSRVYIARTDEGLDVTLQVESGDGFTTLVRFTLPQPPRDSL
jgi:hypothetical protein